MFKIEGDNIYTNAHAATDYSGGTTGTKVTISLAPNVMQLLRRLETMENEWNAQKEFIKSHPAVKNAWEQYQVVCELSRKDHAEYNV